MSDSREEFERTVRATWGDSYSVMRDTDGHYCDDVLDGMWWAWQAARAQGEPASGVTEGWKAAIYYAVTKDGRIQYDTRNGQLEIYETREEALRSCPSSDEVLSIEVKEYTHPQEGEGDE